METKLALDLAFDLPDASELAPDVSFWRLYAESFPSTERESPEVVLATLRAGTGFVLRGRLEKLTIALASVHLLRQPPMPFLVYLAVAPAWRSKQVGTAIFERTWSAAASRYREEGSASPGMVWEVEIPELASDQHELEQRRRRISFFEALGARILPQRYFQPPVDGIASVPMHLMFLAAPGAPLPDTSEIHVIVRAIYFEKYLGVNRIDRDTIEVLLRQTERA